MVEHAHKTADRLGSSFASSPYRPSGKRFGRSSGVFGITEVASGAAVRPLRHIRMHMRKKRSEAAIKSTEKLGREGKAGFHVADKQDAATCAWATHGDPA